MSTYQVRWVESWSREATIDIDEECLRDWIEVPVGPIKAQSFITYLDEMDGFEAWHPGTMPSGADEFYDIDIMEISAPVAELS